MDPTTPIPIPGFSDPISSWTHLLAAGVFLVLSVFLIKNGKKGFGQTVSLIVFSFACVFMLSMSGVYHLLSPGGAGRAVLQRLDHAAIFVLTAATITPIHQIQFKGFMRWGWLLLVWATAITAITLKTIFFEDIPEWLGLTFFLSLGWLGAVTGLILWRRVGFSKMKLVLYGGIAYSAGAILEFARQPVLIEGVLGPHELFHVAVIIAISIHWNYVRKISTDSL